MSSAGNLRQVTLATVIAAASGYLVLLLAARQLVAATLTAELCRKLYAGGVKQFHFYTLNRAELTLGLCHLLGARREPQPENVQ